ncbi:hypothetical protein [Sulfuritalea hydrogenivorans]|jgi:hypothetical protein|uniref:Uncharacterized protein n=1 Tax=Sulfuritalea hydrogenivorans sk43H TaxID=1223802 RepID=W0SAI1_9PROT|nr:hypothetical protein [Sulfuritalea hydrogenivorans]BAO28234.1 hypothetical protein SUTH_00420 [Sulfuritalea hydrogenivorans sk43H]
MEWEFTPQQVVKGEIGYGLADFRKGLAEEVRQNVGGDTDTFTRTYHLLYDLCYALATSKDLETHLTAYAYDPPTVQFLRELAPVMAANVEMLGAILQRQIMDRVEAGMPLENAVSEVADWHRQTVAEHPPTTH